MSTADIEELLQPGEKIDEKVEVGPVTVVVTNQRVLSFDPQSSGRNYRHVERPNVDNVAIRTRSDTGRLVNAGVAFVVAVLLVGTGMFLDLGGLLSVETGPGGEAIGVGGMIGSLRSALGMINDLLFLLGALVGAVGLLYVGLYVNSRTEVVSIDVAGGEDIEYSTSQFRDPRGVVENLRLALDISLERGDTEGGPEWEADSELE